MDKFEITEDIIRTYAESTKDKWFKWEVLNDSRTLPYWLIPINSTITYENCGGHANYSLEARIENSTEIYTFKVGDLIYYNPERKCSMIIDACILISKNNEK